MGLTLKQSSAFSTIMRPTSLNGPDFTHSRNRDGTITSVCNHCPLTIARTVDAADLAELESRHVCQPVERRQGARIVHRTYVPTKQAGDRLGSSGLSRSVKIDLIRAHLFLHPCSRCEKSVEHLSANDERVCFTCQFSLKQRWKALASVAHVPPKEGETGRCHEVQLYSSDEVFLHRFTRFIGAALRVGDAVIVAATESHRNTLFQRLVAEGSDVAAALDQGRYIPLSAADALSTFMVNDSSHPVRFREAVNALLVAAKKAARGKQPHVVACGECAPLLWQEGKAEAAVRLEQLWDEVAKTEGVDILCGYPGGSFRREQGSDTLQRIIAEHSAVHAG